MIVRMTADLIDIWPTATTELQRGYEVSRLGGILRAAFHLFKIEYSFTGGNAYYVFECVSTQAEAIKALGEFLDMEVTIQ